LKISADSAKRAKDTEQVMSPIRWAERSALLAIAEIETVERPVAEFKVTHFAIIGSDESNVVNPERIALLMDELKSIRSSC
jgi:hypothetical protein